MYDLLWNKVKSGSTYWTKNGRNGAINFIAKEGRMSARRITPVETVLHDRLCASWAIEEFKTSIDEDVWKMEHN